VPQCVSVRCSVLHTATQHTNAARTRYTFSHANSLPHAPKGVPLKQKLTFEKSITNPIKISPVPRAAADPVAAVKPAPTMAQKAVGKSVVQGAAQESVSVARECYDRVGGRL